MADLEKIKEIILENSYSDELLDEVENLSSEDRFNLIKLIYPNFKFKVARMGEGDKGANKYKVTIENNGEKFNTTFTDSLYNTWNNTRSSNFEIMYCIISDACTYSYYDTLEDFADNTGYDIYEDRKKVERIFNACKKTYDNIERVFGSDGFEILNGVTYSF